MAFTLSIGAASPVPMAGTLQLKMTANGRDTLNCSILSKDGSYRPAQDARVLYGYLGSIFTGYLDVPRERGFGDVGNVPIITDITAIDDYAIMDRRFINFQVSNPTPQTLKEVLTVLVQNIDGVALHPNQVNGPIIPTLDYVNMKVADVAQSLIDITGYFCTLFGGLLRMYAPGDSVAPFNITVAGGGGVCPLRDVIVEPMRTAEYANTIIIFQLGHDNLVLQDYAQVQLHGQWEKYIIVSPDTTLAAKNALAAAYLAQALPIYKKIRYITHTDGLVPGMTQIITLPSRGLNGVTCLITDITATDVPGTDLLEYVVDLLEGTVWKPGWRKALEGVYHGGSGVSTTTTVTVGVSTGTRYAYFLGGSAIEAVQTAAGAWVAASGIEVVIDTVARGTTAGTVVARLRADAGTVTARVRNLSDGVTVGTSSAVSGAAFQTVIIPVVLTAGSKTYRLELSPSVSNVDIAAIAYVE